MNKLFQPSDSSWHQSTLQNQQIERCHQEILKLNEQLSFIGMEHLLKVKDLQDELIKKNQEINTIAKIRELLETQVDEMGKELNQQYKHNVQIENQLLLYKEAKNTQNGSEEEESRLDSHDATQEELVLINQKAQLLELKNDALIEQLDDAKIQLQILRSKQVQDCNRYQKRIHDLSTNIQNLNNGAQYLTIIKNQNSILHKQLQLKIHQVEELKQRLEEVQQQVSKTSLGQNQRTSTQNNVLLQNALQQIEDLRNQNQNLRSQNNHTLKNQIISIKGQYSTALRENNLLIEQNAQLQKQKNQLFIELERLKKGDPNKKQKAYIAVCEQKNQMYIQLTNTYEQIQKLNNLLIRKEQQIQQLLGKGKPFIAQATVLKTAMQNAQRLQHDHWSSIQDKISILKQENDSLKKASGVFVPKKMKIPYK